MKKCLHKNKHTEMIAGHPSIVQGNIFFGRYSSFTIKEVKPVIITYCSDCGLKLKSIEIQQKLK